ncbi:MAG: VacJ family lipoprotein [Pseudomonadota bacterium]
MLSVIALGIAACAKRPTDPYALAEFEKLNDPLEPLNRFTWRANIKVDNVTLRPISLGYRAITPEPFRVGIRNAFDNISEPWSFVNNLLQGEFGRAGRNLGRVVVNTTVGIGGLFDPATDFGIAAADEDFGETLAVWGVPSGPFLMLPLLGPSNVRDFNGFIVGAFADPVDLYLWLENVGTVNLALTGGQILVRREQFLDEFDVLVKESQDAYAAARSAARQNREFEIYNGNPPVNDENDPFADEDF